MSTDSRTQEQLVQLQQQVRELEASNAALTTALAEGRRQYTQLVAEHQALQERLSAALAELRRLHP